jgi:hypothetical protein
MYSKIEAEKKIEKKIERFKYITVFRYEKKSDNDELEVGRGSSFKFCV